MKSIVMHFSLGWIFIDDRDSPKTAMVWSKGMCGFYFIGDSDNNDFNEYSNDYFIEIVVDDDLVLEFIKELSL